MKILFIAPRLPVPADTGGKIRTLNILIQLAKWATVHLTCFSFDHSDKGLCSQLNDMGIQVTLVPARGPGFVQKVWGVLADPMPVSARKYDTDNMEAVLNELNETNAFDAVHIDHIHMAHYRRCFKDVPCVVDEHNVEYRIRKKNLNSASSK